MSPPKPATPSLSAPPVSPSTAALGLGARAARGGGLLLARHAIAFGVNAAGGIVLARRLGPETMGLYFVAVVFFTIGRQFIDWSTTPILIRGGLESTGDRSALWLQRLLACLLLVVTALLLVAGAARLYAPARSGDLTWLVACAALGAAAWAFQGVPVARLERGLEYARVGRIEVLEPVVFNVLAVGLVLQGAGVRALAVALALRGMVPALAAWRAAPIADADFPGFAAVRAQARAALPLVGAQATLWAILSAPAALVGTLAGTAALGQAQLAATLLGNLGIPAAIFQRVSFASFARLRDEPERFVAAVGRALEWLGLVSLPLMSGIAAFAPLWVPRVCGPEWTPMAAVLLVGALPAALAGLLGIFYAAVLAAGMNRVVLGQNLLHAALYWGVMAGLARPLGAVAVPIAHLVAIPAGILYVGAFRSRLALPPWGGLATGLGAEVVLTAGTAALVLRSHPIVAAIVWCSVHVIVLPILLRRRGFSALWHAALTEGRE